MANEYDLENQDLEDEEVSLSEDENQQEWSQSMEGDDWDEASNDEIDYDKEDESEEDDNKIVISKEEYEQMQKKIQKLKNDKKNAIIKRNADKRNHSDVNNDELIERKIQKYLQEKEEEQLLTREYPDLDIVKLKNFAKNKWLTLLQAYGATNVPKKLKTPNVIKGSPVKQDWFSSSTISSFMKAKGFN